MPGYSPDAPFNRSVTVGLTGTAALDADVVYTAKNVSVSVIVRSDKGTPGNTADDRLVDDAVVTLAAPLPDGSGWATGIEMSGGTNGVYTLDNVVPEVREYRLSVTLRKHSDLLPPRSVRIVPQADGAQTLDPVLMSRASVEIGGSVGRLDSTGGQNLDAPSDATVTLLDRATMTTIAGPIDVRNQRWSFDVPVGNYTVRAQAAGYRNDTEDVTVDATTIALDDPVEVPLLQLRKVLTFAFVVTADGVGGVSGAGVTLGRGTATVTTASTTAGSAGIVAAAGDAMDWAVTRPSDGFGPESGLASPGTPTIDVVLRPSIRGGTVTVDGTATSGITVHRCTSSVPAATCGPTNDVDETDSIAGGAYTFRATPGTWNLRAVDAAGNSATGTIRVLADSAVAAEPLGGSMSIDGTTAVLVAPSLSIVTPPAALDVVAGDTGTTASASWTPAATATSQWRCSTTASVPSGSDCAPGGTFTDVVGTSLELDDLVPGTTYTFEMRSVAGSSTSTVVSTSFTTPAVPPPTALTLGGVGSTEMTATWTVTPGVTYEARIFPTGPASGSFTPVGTGSHLFDGLISDTAYTVEVSATVTTATGTFTSTTASASATTEN
jgi:hypothetical protein